MKRISKDTISGEETIIADNKIPIYHYRNHHLHSFCIGLYIKAGSMYETDAQNGMTHFYEHLLFRKLNHIYNGRLYQLLDSLGLDLSACTYKEFMQVSIKGAAKHFSRASEIIAQIFEPITLSAKEIDLERRRVKAEIREHSDKTSLEYFTQKIVWHDTALQNLIIGQAKVLDKIGVKSLESIQNEVLSEGNLFFYVTGAARLEDVTYLAKQIGRYQLSSGTLLKTNMAPVPRDFFNRKNSIHIKNSNFHYLRFSFDVDVSRYTYAELDLLYDILFSGDTSKLYQELCEKSGYIYSFDARLERYANLGNLYFYFEIDKKRILPAVRKVIEIVNDLKHNLTDELRYILPKYTDNALMLLDDDEALNWTMAYDCHIMNCCYKRIEEMKTSYEDVTAERLMVIAGEIFQPRNMVVTLKTKRKDFPLKDMTEILNQLTSLKGEFRGVYYGEYD